MKMKSILKNKSMQKLQKMCSAKNMIVFLKYALIIILSFVSLNYLMNYLSPQQDYYQGPGSLIEGSKGKKLTKEERKEKRKARRAARRARQAAHKADHQQLQDGVFVTSKELEDEIDLAIQDAGGDGMTKEEIRELVNEMKEDGGVSGPSEQEIDQMIQSKINQYAVSVADEFDRLKTPDILMETDDGKNPTRDFASKLHNPALNRLAIASPGHRIVRDHEFNKKMSKSLGGGDESLRQRMRNDRFSFLNPSSSGYESTLSRFFTAMLPVSHLNYAMDDKNEEKRRGPLSKIQSALGLRPGSYLGGDPYAARTLKSKRMADKYLNTYRKRIQDAKDKLEKPGLSFAERQQQLVNIRDAERGIRRGSSVNFANKSTKHAMNAIKTEREYLMHLGAMKALQAHEAAHINAKKYNFYPYGPNTLNVYNDDHIKRREEGIKQFTANTI